MAQTQAQLLKAAKEQLAKTKARLQAAEDQQAILNASTQSSTVNTTTMAGITAASRGETGYVPPVDTYTSAQVGNTGLTQAQIDAQTNAIETAKLIGGTLIPNPDGPGLKVVAPTTTPVIKKSTTDNNNNNNNNDNNNNNNNNNNIAITLVSTERDEYGNVIGVYSDGTTKILIPSGRKYKSTVDENAYAILKSTFADYGLDDPDLLKEIEGYMERGLGSEQAGLELRKTKAYTTRFAGNESRRAAGLNVLSEAAYLELENSYKETLRAYGQQGFFGTDRKVAQSKMADIIGNDISATEFKDRVDAVVTRVNNSEPSIKSTLKAFYNIGDEDLIAYFLSPKENLPKLQEKVTSAEIGSEALKQNLITDVASASALARMGITKAQAKEGYETISGVLPTASKLGQIYGEEGINYGQKTAEEEVFAQLESAKRKRLRLAEKEVGSFSGTSGLGRNALGSGKSSAF
jgi:hypothetical protein